MSGSENLVKRLIAIESATPLTHARLTELLTYDRDTGVFRWNHRRNSNAPAGSVAGSNCHGYVNISIDGRKYRAHRLAWLYVNETWPTSFIDHINGVRCDNRFLNLRIVTVSQNMQNQRRVRRDSSTGIMGVQISSDKKSFTARIKVGGKNLYLGTFKDIELAASAYIAAKREMHSACSI